MQLACLQLSHRAGGSVLRANGSSFDRREAERLVMIAGEQRGDSEGIRFVEASEGLTRLYTSESCSAIWVPNTIPYSV